MRILMIEDEKDLVMVLTETLSQEGYDVDAANDGVYGLDCALSGIYDVIILDVMLPELDGFGVLRELRSRNISTPVLMLTAKSEVTDRVTGLDCGADDYLTKPFYTDEMLARLRALGRRKAQTYQSDTIAFADITLDKLRHALRCGSQNIKLSKKEFQIMELLLSNPSQLILKERLITKIWGYDSETEYNSVEVYISFLRKKLIAVGSAVHIVTARGLGYSLEETEDGLHN